MVIQVKNDIPVFLERTRKPFHSPKLFFPIGNLVANINVNESVHTK